MIKLLILVIISRIERLFHLLRTIGVRRTWNDSVAPKIRSAAYILTMIRMQGMRKAFNYVGATSMGITGNPLINQYLRSHVTNPRSIWIEPSTRCNLKCIICEHTFWKEPSRDMSYEQFVSIINQFPDLRSIVMTGIGEAFLNKDFLKMLALLNERGIVTEVTDNFTMLDRETVEKLVELKVDRLVLSMDGATKTTYEHMRPGATFEKVIDNIHCLIAAKKKAGTIFPRFDIHYIICKDNMHEVTDFVKLVDTFGKGEVGEVRFTRLLYPYPEVKGIFTEVPPEIINEAAAQARHQGLYVTWGVEIPKNKPGMDQCVNWTAPFIFVTGDVIPCAVANESNRRDWQKAQSMGNIFQQPFKEIWNGPRFTGFRRDIINELKVPACCADCCVFDTTCHSKEIRE